MEKEKIMLAMSELSTREIEDIISFGKDELHKRDNEDWLKAVNEVMTAIHRLKYRFPCATCYVECEKEDYFDLLTLFETITEDSFQQEREE